MHNFVRLDPKREFLYQKLVVGSRDEMTVQYRLKLRRDVQRLELATVNAFYLMFKLHW